MVSTIFWDSVLTISEMSTSNGCVVSFSDILLLNGCVPSFSDLLSSNSCVPSFYDIWTSNGWSRTHLHKTILFNKKWQDYLVSNKVCVHWCTCTYMLKDNDKYWMQWIDTVTRGNINYWWGHSLLYFNSNCFIITVTFDFYIYFCNVYSRDLLKKL